jgi:hypothetical protein
VEALQWGATSYLIPSGCQTGREDIGRGRRKTRDRGRGGGKLDMVSTISFIQANLQHSIAAARIFAKTLSTTGNDMGLIQEPWYRENCIKDLNIPGYTLYSAAGKDRPRACILVGSMTSWMLPEFSCRDLVAVLVKYFEDRVENGWWSVLLIFSMIPRILLLQKNLRNSCIIVRKIISI